MQIPEWCLQPLTDLARLIRTGELSPVELTGAVLSHIEATEPLLNTYITVLREQALSEARAAERNIRLGHYLGPLHGIPVGLKDLIDMRGVRTTAGSAVLADNIPDEDATVVAKLRQAGAVIIGKHNLHEFALGNSNNNQTFGPAHNPWRLSHVPGGSSGGSAASVSAGGCTVALGTDTGGSIRMPAASCGVVGLLPTYGRVSRYGVVPLSWSLDHVGPITRTVTDAAIVLGIIAGYDPLDITTQPERVPDYVAGLEAGVKGLRVGIPQNYFFDSVDPEVQAAVETAIQVLVDQGAVPVEVHLPHVELSVLAQLTIVLSEAAAYHEPLLRDRGDQYAPDIRVRLEAGLTIPAAKYLKAQRLRTLIKQSFRAAMAQVDVIATPTLPMPPVAIGQETAVLGGREVPVQSTQFRNVCPIDESGQPAIAVPCGFTRDGLPISLQLIGRPFDEATLLRAARAYEVATDWHTRRPPLV